jgi:hypothetical protein
MKIWGSGEKFALFDAWEWDAELPDKAKLQNERGWTFLNELGSTNLPRI